MGVLDLGEMFLNFPLPAALSPVCGIDLSPYIPEAKSWERWVRLMMGLKVSPYLAIKATHFAFKVVLGDRKDPTNVFHWTKVILNLPGSAGYDPTQPRVWRYNPVTQGLVATVLSYVDDLRALGLSEAECWQVMHKVATVLTALGIQVAGRKRVRPQQSQDRGQAMVAWGDETGGGVRATRAKWSKAKAQLDELHEELVLYQEGRTEGLDFKRLESVRGFLVHMQLTYPALTPYLKGLPLTLDSWRPGRDEEGWKITSSSNSLREEESWDDLSDKGVHAWDSASIHPPALVHPAPQVCR